MIPSFEQRHSAGGIARPCFGGSSSSSASTTSEAEMNGAGRDNSNIINARMSDSTLTVISTDQGAVAAGKDVALKAIAANTSVNQGAMQAGQSMFDGALGAVTKANERLALAYQSGQAGDQTSLKYVGFIVVGLAAVTLFGKK